MYDYTQPKVLAFKQEVVLKNAMGKIEPQVYTVDKYCTMHATVVDLRFGTTVLKSIDRKRVFVRTAKPEPKALFKDAETSADEKLMADFLYAKTMDEVITLACNGVDLSKFNLETSKVGETQWAVLIPKDAKGKLPVLMAHCDIHPNVKEPTVDNLEYSEDKVFTSPTGLGADDRAGVYAMHKVMLEQPENFIFCFFDLEEVGCVGSRAYTNSGHFKTKTSKLASAYFSIDRKRGLNGLKTLATYNCDNDTLNSTLSKALNRTIQSGSSTDCKVLASASTADTACLNFSCGYLNEHTNRELLHFTELEETVKDLLSMKELVPDLWVKHFKAKKVATSYYGDYYSGMGYTPKAKTKKVKAKLPNIYDEGMFVDDYWLDEDTAKELIQFYEYATDTSFVDANGGKFIPEISEDDLVELKETFATINIVGKRILNNFTVNKMKDQMFTVYKEHDFKVDLINITTQEELFNIPKSVLKTIGSFEATINT